MSKIIKKTPNTYEIIVFFEVDCKLLGDVFTVKITLLLSLYLHTEVVSPTQRRVRDHKRHFDRSHTFLWYTLLNHRYNWSKSTDSSVELGEKWSKTGGN
jgi:hypothetical protein